MILDKNKDILSIVNNALNYAQTEDPCNDYEIELGVDLLYEIIIQQEDSMYSNVLVNNKDDKPTLFGQVLRINYEDPYVFKLWKCII